VFSHFLPRSVAESASLPKSLQTLFPNDVATEVLTAYDVGDVIEIRTETSDFQIFSRYCST
jgi:hypothetical protein